MFMLIGLLTSVALGSHDAQLECPREAIGGLLFGTGGFVSIRLHSSPWWSSGQSRRPRLTMPRRRAMRQTRRARHEDDNTRDEIK